MAAAIFGSDLLTELKLGLPGSDDESESCVRNNNKRSSAEMDDSCGAGPAPKAQVVGWPPVRSYRRNANSRRESEGCGMYVKVSMDGAPYLRKVDLKFYSDYSDLLKALEGMFKCTIGVYCEREGCNGSEYTPTYEDKDGDWMLVGDVPWEMFTTSCKRMRIMKGTEVKGLGCI